MCLTPVATLNAFSSLAPIHLLLNDMCHNAALRLASAPPEHPLYKAVLRCAKGRKRHVPPLQHILKHANIHPSRLEKWQAGTNHKVATHMQPFPTKQIARTAALRDNTYVKVFTDGSLRQNKSGAAALLYEGTARRLRAGWRRETEDPGSILEAEVAAIMLGLHLVQQYSPTEDVVIYSDSQLAIKCVHGHRTKAPSSIAKASQRLFKRVKKSFDGVSIRIDWCPAHVRIRGNEEADHEAREAAEGKVYPSHMIPDFLTSYHPLADPAKERELQRTRNKNLAAQIWQDSEACAKLTRRYRDADPAAYFGLTHGLNRSRASLWIRLVTGHVQLNAHLQRIGATPSDTCGQCGLEQETVAHFILRCPTYADIRYEHLGSRGREFLCLNHLFFTKDALQALFRYIKASGRFIGSLR
jgi:ribonuclease HI